MTLRCRCGGAVRMTDSNGRTDPSEVRREYYDCVDCGRSGQFTLLPNGHYTIHGCLDRGDP